MTASTYDSLTVNPAFQVSHTESGLALFNPYEGSRFVLPAGVARVLVNGVEAALFAKPIKPYFSNRNMADFIV